MALLVLPVAVFTLAALAAPVGAQYAGTPTLTFDKTSVVPGEVLQVTVAGCGPVGSVADIVIDGVVVGQGTIGASGGFAGPYTVPTLAQGDVQVEVRFCFNEVLSGTINVDVGNVPFIDPGQQQGGQPGQPGQPNLPRTGADGVGPMVRVAVGLIGVGALLVFVVPRYRRRQLEQAAAGAH